MKTVAKGAETKLLEVVNSLKETPDGYYALHYNLSRLQEEFRSDYQVKIAVNILGDLFKTHDSIAFIMKDYDVVLLYNGSNRALLEKAIFQLRYLFMDDPLGYTDDGYENEDFCTVYDLEFQWRDFFVACKRKIGKEAIIESLPLAAPTAKIETPTGNRDKLHVFSPPYLVQVISELADKDISVALRSQPICAVMKGKEPKIMFKEVYTNLNHLQQIIPLNVDLRSSKTLLKYLTKVLDKKVLGVLKDKASMHTAPISINLNVVTLFTEEFAEFDSVVAPKHKPSIIIEIHVADVFEDINKFVLARNTLQSLGYRVCLDGLNDLSFKQIDRNALGFDLAKLSWSPEMGTKSNKENDEELAAAVKRCGPTRIVLCRCDNQAAIDYGKSIGISLYQGHHVDSLLEPALALALSN